MEDRQPHAGAYDVYISHSCKRLESSSPRRPLRRVERVSYAGNILTDGSPSTSIFLSFCFGLCICLCLVYDLDCLKLHHNIHSFAY